MIFPLADKEMGKQEEACLVQMWFGSNVVRYPCFRDTNEYGERSTEVVICNKTKISQF